MRPVKELRLPEGQSLADFLGAVPKLDPLDRFNLCEQALNILNGYYVHLDLKRAMHAIDPVQRLRLLQRRQAELSHLEFQSDLLGIFMSLRDRHTVYQLGEPFRGRVATLGFLVEEFYREPDGPPSFVASHVPTALRHGSFEQGVELLAWNGIPIQLAVARNAEREGGSNQDARHARGLEALTFRSLRMSLPPDERFVIVEYQTAAGRSEEIRIGWVVVDEKATDQLGPWRPSHDAAPTLAAAHGIDVAGEAARRVKSRLFAGNAAARRTATVDPLDAVIRSSVRQTAKGPIGYVRIFSFNVANVSGFLAKVSKSLAALRTKRVIIDIRGNPGGLILAAEGLLALLNPRGVFPMRFSLANTPQTLALCDEIPGFRPWLRSISDALLTGETYSQAFPLSNPAALAAPFRPFDGDVVLITDARSYSAADIFAAGFQDNAPQEGRRFQIMGTDRFTGAGGANVWSHDLLRTFLPDRFQQLPGGAGFRVALRRATRVGPETFGIPLEDLGVTANRVHRLTHRDVVGDNIDLIESAAELF